MCMEEQDYQIVYYSELLKKHFEKSLTSVERQELAQWLWQDRQNRVLYRRIKSGNSLKAYYEVYKETDPVKEYRLLVARYPELRENNRLRRLQKWSWIAALFIAVLGTVVWYKYGNVRQAPEVLPSEAKVMAILKTSGGEVFCLHGNQDSINGKQISGLQIRESLKELICEQLSLTDSLVNHELIIPRGGEYKLILADGTKVWLNSESEIRFPAVFGEKEREISLLGEAYLEVSHDSKRPFRVKAAGGIIEVLGTSFGLSIYPGEHKWSAVLVRGSVKVKYGADSLVLQPGKEAYLENGFLNQRVCDTEKEFGWVKGLFIFRHDRLEDVVRTLTRWYDMEFRYEDESLKEYVFTGQVSRDLGIDQILSLMERMNVVSFEKTDNRILIKKKAGRF